MRNPELMSVEKTKRNLVKAITELESAWGGSSGDLQRCIAALKGCTDGAEEMGANEEVRLEAVATLKKCEKDMKALDVKNEEDKEKALEDTAKAAKKLKKGKGKKK